MLSALKGNDVVVEALLQREELDLTKVDRDGNTALSYAFAFSPRDLTKSAKIVNMLLAKNASKVDKTVLGLTPWMQAAQVGNLNILTLLLNEEICAEVDNSSISRKNVLSVSRKHILSEKDKVQCQLCL